MIYSPERKGGRGAALVRKGTKEGREGSGLRGGMDRERASRLREGSWTERGSRTEGWGEPDSEMGSQTERESRKEEGELD